jgi:hypothetical protein
MKKQTLLAAALGIAVSASTFSGIASATSYVDGYWGALAFDQRTQAYGWSSGYDDQYDAEDRALDECGRRCELITSYFGECAAIATGYDGGYGWSTGSSLRRAERAAIRQCRNYDDGCEVLISQCSD